MYLQNTSESTVILRTKKGMQVVKPGAYLILQDRDVINLTSSLEVISEQQYEAGTSSKDESKVINTKDEGVTVNEDLNSTESSASDIEEDESKKVIEGDQDTVETTDDSNKDETTDDSKKDQAVDDSKKDETFDVDSKNVGETKSETKDAKRSGRRKLSQEEIEKRLDELKIAWEEAATPKQKESYAKQIKDLNKKLKG